MFWLNYGHTESIWTFLMGISEIEYKFSSEEFDLVLGRMAVARDKSDCIELCTKCIQKLVILNKL